MINPVYVRGLRQVEKGRRTFINKTAVQTPDIRLKGSKI
jgi:hypothetical protein